MNDAASRRGIPIGLLALGLVLGAAALALTLGGPRGREVALEAPTDEPEARRSVSRADLEAPVEREAPAEAAGGGEGARGRTENEEELGLLAGAGGRLLEHDRRPVAGADVVLLEWDPLTSFPLAGTPDAPRFLVDRDRTDEEGRFQLRGARPRAMGHVLGIDLGGARATLRTVRCTLTSGEVCGLGDVLLDPVATLRGRVVDGDRRPLRGARVTLLPSWAEEASPHLAELVALRAGSVLATKEGGIDLPSWMAELERLLPVPHTRTDGDGAFVFARAPIHAVVLAADAPGHVPHVDPTVTLRPEEDQEFGTIRLAEGRVVEGVVLDAAGSPAAGCEVTCGPRVEDVGFLPPPVRTGADGRFRIPGLPAHGKILVAARRAAHHPYHVGAASWPEETRVRLPAEVDRRIEVRGADGKPARGARGTVTLPEVPPFLWSLAMDEAEPGVLVARALPDRPYVVRLRAPGHAPASRGLEGGGGASVQLTGARESRFEVIDGASGDPVEGALVTAFEEELDAFSFLLAEPLARARSDALGKGVLGGLASRELWVGVVHPAFPPLMTEISDKEPLFVLSRGGEVHVRVVPPRPGLRVKLRPVATSLGGLSSLFAYSPSFSGFTDGEGRTRIAGVATGTYRCSVEEEDPFDPVPAADVEAEVQVIVRDGERSEVELRL